MRALPDLAIYSNVFSHVEFQDQPPRLKIVEYLHLSCEHLFDLSAIYLFIYLLTTYEGYELLYLCIYIFFHQFLSSNRL